MFSPGSRYERVPTSVHVDRDGRQHPYVLLRTFPPDPPTQQHHVFAEHERLDLIAYRVFGDSEQFWRICDANRTLRPDSLETLGLRLDIPVVTR